MSGGSRALGAGQCVQMGLTVRVPRTDVLYQSQQNVTGQGFVRSYRDYSTSRLPALLTNRVYVSSDQMQLSASANVKILAEEGTELSLREHGSGDYESREDLRFLTTNKSIRLERSVRASYHPTTISLPGNGSQKVSCLWHEEVRAKNGITNTSFEESYRYSANLDSESLFDLDENQSKMQIKSDFQGLAHLGTLKLPAPGRERRYLFCRGLCWKLSARGEHPRSGPGPDDGPLRLRPGLCGQRCAGPGAEELRVGHRGLSI